ncbi:uncharacterized protein LOC112681501 [Sipha flava]|uniref:Uncharacterized protein LOC112681501 n=1 Tax=Sipha flava TaxID=143950 RepID=A0A8B8FAV5_9HEMI|nr:uncharacterized protein LOC112681501 [Sipha flava]
MTGRDSENQDPWYCTVVFRSISCVRVFSFLSRFNFCYYNYSYHHHIQYFKIFLKSKSSSNFQVRVKELKPSCTTSHLYFSIHKHVSGLTLKFCGQQCMVEQLELDEIQDYSYIYIRFSNTAFCLHFSIVF